MISASMSPSPSAGAVVLNAITDPTTTRQARYLPTLDGWRAIAILMVIAHHASHSMRRVIPGASPLSSLAVRYGRHGVLIFFGLSGFLITTRLLTGSSTSPGVALRSFYIRRFYRILP